MSKFFSESSPYCIRWVVHFGLLMENVLKKTEVLNPLIFFAMLILVISKDWKYSFLASSNPHLAFLKFSVWDYPSSSRYNNLLVVQRVQENTSRKKGEVGIQQHAPHCFKPSFSCTGVDVTINLKSVVETNPNLLLKYIFYEYFIKCEMFWNHITRIFYKDPSSGPSS